MKNFNNVKLVQKDNNGMKLQTNAKTYVKSMKFTTRLLDNVMKYHLRRLPWPYVEITSQYGILKHNNVNYVIQLRLDGTRRILSVKHVPFRSQSTTIHRGSVKISSARKEKDGTDSKSSALTSHNHAFLIRFICSKRRSAKKPGHRIYQQQKAMAKS